MSETDLQLLARYTRNLAEDAFAELVSRHLGLVYSAALRQVRSPQLAEEVAQTVFTDLARNAAKLSNGAAATPVLTAWLYQVARRTAIDVVRREARRQLREQIATEMNAMKETAYFAKYAEAADWTHIEPLLDEAMSALDDTDRTAVLLRYFENKSLLEVGVALGTSDDAAQKRVSRAVDRLREFFAKRGVTVGASGLVVVISANAVQAAPIGLAVTISTAAALAGTAFATTATKTIAMTTIQKTIVAATLTASIGTGIYEARQVSRLRDENQTLQQQQAPFAEQIEQLSRERDDATRQVAGLRDENGRLNRNTTELLRLRGEVGVLRNAVQDSKQAETDSIHIAAKSWIAKVDVLKKWIEPRPEQQIPEFQYLRDYDWLDAVKSSNMMGDHAPANAMRGLREAAKRQFAHEMSNALRRFVEEHNGDLPADLSQLNAYFTQPMNDAILKSYKLLNTGKLADLPKNEWLVGEIAPPFDAYDDRRMMIRTNDFILVRREK